MSRFCLSHKSDAVLLIDTRELAARSKGITAELVAHLAEVEARRLHIRLGYDSMTAYCAGELNLKDHEAHRRIEAARQGRAHPVIFEALADGRLHLTAIVVLAPYLARGDADALLAECFGKTKSQIELVLARRFPQPDAPMLLTPIATAPSAPTQVVANTQNDSLQSESHCGFASTYGAHSGAPISPRLEPSRITPTAPQRWKMQVTISQETHDLLREAQELLAHSIPSRDLDAVLNRALRELVRQVKARKCGAWAKPRAASPSRGGKPDERRIPVAIKRAVWQRDGGRWTFVGSGGHRCETRARLEFDHV